MSLPKILALTTLVLFVTIGIAAIVQKSRKKTSEVATVSITAPIAVELGNEVRIVKTPPQQPAKVASTDSKPSVPAKSITEKNSHEPIEKNTEQKPEKPLPSANRIQELFNRAEPRLPIVETITYRSRVPWQKGRPAWLSDYAAYYSTSRHFIARSLNGKPDYFKQDVAEGDRFNVLRKDKNIHFYLLIDASRCKMWLYYIDQDTNERVLLKDYLVGLGREDSAKESGLLTPLGKYSLGNRIAIYKPKMTGIHNGQKVEMMRVFGTRWIPFDKEIGETTMAARGLGVHGVPWRANERGELVEDLSSLGKYQSDGCIRLATPDIEELFSIIITKPTTIELVKDFYQAKPPGIEK